MRSCAGGIATTKALRVRFNDAACCCSSQIGTTSSLKARFCCRITTHVAHHGRKYGAMIPVRQTPLIWYTLFINVADLSQSIPHCIINFI